MISLIKAAIRNGYDIVVINYRGLGGVPLKVMDNCSIIYILYYRLQGYIMVLVLMILRKQLIIYMQNIAILGVKENSLD
jgi:hypothetical protein